MTFQRIITFCFIAMLLMICAGVNDGQFDESNWGRLTEPLSRLVTSTCAPGALDKKIGLPQLSIFHNRYFYFSTINVLHVSSLEERVVCWEQEILDRAEHCLLCRRGHDHLHPRPPGPQQEAGWQPGDYLHLHRPGHQPTPQQGRGLSPGEAGSLVPPGAIWCGHWPPVQSGYELQQRGVHAKCVDLNFLFDLFFAKSPI